MKSKDRLLSFLQKIDFALLAIELSLIPTKPYRQQIIDLSK